ncbi:MAG: DUF3108 domain-containing protein [Puniceicoccaceae bacterium]
MHSRITQVICFFVLIVLPASLVIARTEEGAEGILEQLPPELEQFRVDPLTVEKSPPFIEGEQLRFRLGWGVFSVARATLQCVEDMYEEQPAWKISLATRTNGFADPIYKVRNHSTSWISRDVSRSFEYRADQNEGGRKRDSQALFDTENLTGSYFNKLTDDRRGPVEILPGTFDPLGIVFFLRSLDFEVGDEIIIPTSNGKEFFYTNVHVIKKVKRRFKYGGRQEAYVIEPDIKDVGGVFKRSPDGHIRFYISADERRLPLRMESEVIVGNFWAELVAIEEPETTLPSDSDDSVAVAEVE